MINFPDWILDCDCHSSAILNLLLSSSIWSTMAFHSLGNSDHVVVSISIDSLSNFKGDAQFHRLAYQHSCIDWDGLHDR